MTDFYVYEHWRPDINVCFYVGKGRGRRARVMYRRSDHHNRIQQKLRDLGMQVEVRITHQGLSEMEALRLEVEIIAQYGLNRLVNLTGGGDGLQGKYVSDETRRRMSEAHKGHVVSAETRRKIAEANFGKKKPRRFVNPKVVKPPRNYRVPLGPLSEQHKQRISEGRRRGIASRSVGA